MDWVESEIEARIESGHPTEWNWMKMFNMLIQAAKRPLNRGKVE